MAYAILRLEKIKSVSTGNSRLMHSRRQLPCQTLKSEPNYVRITCNSETRRAVPRSFKQIFRERTQGQKIRANAVHAIEAVLTFSPGAIVERDTLHDWAQANIDWLAKTFGGVDNIIDMRLHLDETTPHIHAFVIPIDERGKLNARAFLGGTRQRMVEIQTEYAKAMEPFGLERGVSREITRAKHQDHKRWISSNAEKETRLQAYENVCKPLFVKDLELHLDFSKEAARLENEASEGKEIEQEHRDIDD